MLAKPTKERKEEGARKEKKREGGGDQQGKRTRHLSLCGEGPAWLLLIAYRRGTRGVGEIDKGKGGINARYLPFPESMVLIAFPPRAFPSLNHLPLFFAGVSQHGEGW